MSNALTNKEQGKETIRGFLTSNAAAIGKAINGDRSKVDRVIRLAMTVIERNEALLKCNPKSLLGAVVLADHYGLEVDGVSRQAALVPFKGDVVLIPQYQGLKELARRHPSVDSVHTDAVHEGDTFKFSGADSKPLHERSSDGKRRFKPVVGAYCYAKFNSGSIVSDYWSVDECKAHRDAYSENWKRSKKGENLPWHEKNPAFPKMCQKTVLRSMVGAGDIPISTQVKEVIDRATVVEGEVAEPTTLVVEPDLKQLESIGDPEPGGDDLFGVCESVEEVENTLKDIRKHANNAAEVDDLVRRAGERIQELEGAA